VVFSTPRLFFCPSPDEERTQAFSGNFFQFFGFALF
jgi:hypothetical protein